MRAVELPSAVFRKEREGTWYALEALVERCERGGLRALTADELVELPTLYRATLSSLSVARAISLDQNLLAWLESLSARAYVCVYGGRRQLPAALLEFARDRLPGTLRALWRPFLIACLALLAGIATAWIITLSQPEHFYVFVSPEYAGGRDPGSSTAGLRDTLYANDASDGELSLFTSFLFTHNARIGLLCFALGAALGVPVVLLLFYNGLVLGAFAGLFQDRGLGLDFWGWVLPHGITELLAVLLCGTAGLTLGGAMLFPRRRRRLDRLLEVAREAARLVIGAVGLFALAALIEGVFRQRVDDPQVRYGVAAVTLLLWAGYFGWVGRRRA